MRSWTAFAAIFALCLALGCTDAAAGEDADVPDGGGRVDAGPPACLVDCPLPSIAFTDLISGPGVGLGDPARGSGVVVTLWGQHFGGAQGDSTAHFRDAAGTEHDAEVFYWKNADGALPGGPANLFESHGMYEVAISIPAAVTGEGFLYLTVGGEATETRAFAVRAGGIFGVTADGSDAAGDGSWTSPWQTVDHALDTVDEPGATVYVHDGVHSGWPDSVRGIYGNNASASSGCANQFAIVAYPGAVATAQGQRGVTNYRNRGLVMSKHALLASNCEDRSGQPGGDQTGTFRIENNIVIGWSEAGAPRSLSSCIGFGSGGPGVFLEISDNICVATEDRAFVNHVRGSGPETPGGWESVVTMANHVWHYAGTGAVNAITPDWELWAPARHEPRDWSRRAPRSALTWAPRTLRCARRPRCQNVLRACAGASAIVGGVVHALRPAAPIARSGPLSAAYWTGVDGIHGFAGPVRVAPVSKGKE